jgi:hypothetical protein
MSGLPHKPVLFIDRNSGGRIFRDLITAEGIEVVLHDERFPDPKTPDIEWLSEIGDEGWIMITGDIGISRSPLCLSDLARSKARVFILNGLNGGTREGKAKCIISSYERVVNICQTREAPLLWKINKDGTRKEIDFRKHLARMKRHRRIQPILL